MKKYLLCISLFLCVLSKSQTLDFNQDLTVNKLIVHESTPALDSVISFMRVYHEAFFSNQINRDVFFTKKTCENYMWPIFMLGGQLNGYELSKLKANIISIYRPELNYRAVQVGYSYYDTVTKSIGVVCVYTYGVTRENDSLKIFPIIDTYKFDQHKKDFVTYNNIVPSSANAQIADTLNTYNKKVARFFNIDPIKFSCYQFQNFSQLNTCIGFDVCRNYSRLEKNAYADMYNKIIYSTGVEDYFHELVHLYVGNEYLETCNEWINEGLATYLGGSYLTLNEHLKKLNEDLKKHPEYDLNDFFTYKEKFIDIADTKQLTGYEYTLGGLICKLTYEKKGFEGLRTLLMAGYEKEKLYTAIENVLGVKQNNFNTYLRNEIAKY